MYRVLSTVPGCMALLSHTVPLPPAAGRLGVAETHLSSYLAEDDGLANGDAAVNVAQSLVLVLPVPAQHIILSDVVQGQLLFA